MTLINLLIFFFFFIWDICLFFYSQDQIRSRVISNLNFKREIFISSITWKKRDFIRLEK